MILTIPERIELGNVLSSTGVSIEEARQIREFLFTELLPGKEEQEAINGRIEKGKFFFDEDKETNKDINFTELVLDVLKRVYKEIDESKSASVNALGVISLIEKIIVVQ